ncbi:MAG: hypothetical protein K2N47_02480 [Clostridia bacterium]|nr:hypothetical protein [Clostridia bacterium]
MTDKNERQIELEKSLPAPTADGELNKEGKRTIYRLASPASARIEGHAGKVSPFLLFAIVWLVFLVVITVANLAVGDGFEVPMIIIVSVFSCVGVGLLTFGIYDQRRQMNASAEERRLLDNCLCTDGIIESCVCQVHVRHGRHSNSHSYTVTLTYSYEDAHRRKVIDKHSATYGYDPEFYKGQYIMVAFDEEGKSRILNRFKFVPEDERAFLENEAARSDDDFDGLDGKLVKRNGSEKIKSAEFPQVWLWVSIPFFVFAVAYTVPISILVVPQIMTGRVMPDLIFILLLYFMPVGLTALGIFLLTRFFKGRGRLKAILENSPKYTRGKVFASERTYRGGSKVVLYCYIDDEGKRHTKELKSPYYRKTVHGKAKQITVAYDDSGKSIPLQ